MKGVVARPVFGGTGYITGADGKTYAFTLYACVKNGTTSASLQAGKDVFFGARHDGHAAWVSSWALTPAQEAQLQHLVDRR